MNYLNTNNFLNTNVILERNQNNSNNNEQFMNKIKSLLTQNRNITNNFMNNTTQKLEYIGEGINGSMYKISKLKTSINDGKYYIVKVFKHNKSTLPQIKKELRILKKLTSNDAVMEVINPCIDTIITKSYIITVFDSFNGMTLREFVAQCHRKELDSKARDTLLKYCFKQIFIALNRIHSLGICHLQLTPESILIKLNITSPEKLAGNNLNNGTMKSNRTNIMEFNNKSDVKDTDFKGIDKDKIYPVNTGVYRSYSGNDNPVVIKFTNFGMGCGKLQNLSLSDMSRNNLNNMPQHSRLPVEKSTIDIISEKCNLSGLPLLDPYMSKFDSKISKIKNNSKLIKLGMRYDLFNIGLIGLMCICNADFYNKEFSNIDDYNNNFSRYLNNIKTWSEFLSIAKNNILDSDDFGIYYDNISKYCLGPISERKDSRYVQNNIIMLEKHKNL
jgi:serine/threonine protein kinase